MLPPPGLRHRVHGALDEKSYRDAGRVLAARVVEVLRNHGVSADARVLDFACGPGRVATECKRLCPAWELHGSDIDREAIDWARSHLAEVGRFSVNPQVPPTDFPAACFAAGYSISLFTHLDEAAQFSWLTELNRVMRPGGILLLTTHGERSLASCTPEELDDIRSRGFAYRVGRRGWLKVDGLPDSYQTTFHSRGYIEKHWGKMFEIVQYEEGGLDGLQDLIVLRKPGG